MRYRHLVMGLVAAVLATGCAGLDESIENRVKVSEECRATLATPPYSLRTRGSVTSAFIGNTGHCNLMDDESFLAMCSLAQVRTKHGIAPFTEPELVPPLFQNAVGRLSALNRLLPKPESPTSDRDNAIVSFYRAVDAAGEAVRYHDRPTIWTEVGKLRSALSILAATHSDVGTSGNVEAALQEARKITDDLSASLVLVIGSETMQADLDAFDQAVSDLRAAMKALAENTRQFDAGYQKFLTSVTSDNYANRTIAMGKVSTGQTSTKSAVRAVHRAHDATRRAAERLSANLSSQAAIELAAWDSNLRVQLAQLEQLLSGDFTLVFEAGIRDQVLTYVARRSLELLHGALKPADAVINRLDDKAYGLVSVGYLVFGPDIQKTVNKGIDKITDVYEARPKDKNSQNFLPTGLFMFELKRAACDNLTQGTQFSMLSELVDTMLIAKVKSKLKDDTPATILPEKNSTDSGATSLHAPKVAMSSLPLMQARFNLRSTIDTPAAPTQHAPEITPLSVYAVNQWVARQQLLTQKIKDAVMAPQTDGSPKPSPFQNIETVDEGLVKQIADAATAKAIDDAARLDPSMLNRVQGNVSTQIQNSVNVVTAATAVSQASAVLKLNLSISNVNTFSPTNSNTVSPVINVGAPAGVTNAASPCTAIDFESAGIRCFDRGGSMVLDLSRRNFRSDSCMPDDIAPALAAAGSMLKGYRVRTGTTYTATVEGHASLPNSRLAHCPGNAAKQVPVCHYVNALRQSVSIVGCDRRHTNRNLVLSAERARVAADALESAAEGAVVVDGLLALGTQTAGKREPGALPAIDQAVVIRLTPGYKP